MSEELLQLLHEDSALTEPYEPLWAQLQDDSTELRPFETLLCRALAVPTPEEVHDPLTAQLIRAVERASHDAWAVNDSNKWKPVKAPKGLREPLDRVDVIDDGKRVVARVKTTMAASAEQVLETIRNGNQNPKGTRTTKIKQISSSQPEISLLHVELQLPSVSDRDFVICQCIRPRDGGYEVVCVSLPKHLAEAWCPVSSKHVRGAIKMQSTMILPVKGRLDECQLRWISCVDLAGAIPSLATLTAQKGADAVLTLQKAAVRAETLRDIRSRGAKFAAKFVASHAPHQLQQTDSIAVDEAAPPA